jgi:FeS assembly protein SufD
LKSIEHNLSEVYTANFDFIAEGFPARLNAERAGFMENFMLSGVPSARDERFLQSDMQALFGAEEREMYFTRPAHNRFNKHPEACFEEIPGIRTVVFENGFSTGKPGEAHGNPSIPSEAHANLAIPSEAHASPAIQDETHSLPDGVFCGSIRDAFGLLPERHLFHVEQNKHNERADLPTESCSPEEMNVPQNEAVDARMSRYFAVEIPTDHAGKAGGDTLPSEHEAQPISPELLTIYNSLADNRGDALTALNSAFMQDGALVWVPAGVRLTEPLLLDFRFSSDEEALMSFGRILIVLGDGAQADISVLYRTGGKTRFLVDIVREIVIGEGAKLNFSECALIREGSSLLLNGYMRQRSNSLTDSVFTSLGGGFSRLAMQSELAGEHAEANTHGLYIAADRTHSDIELRLSHLTPDCRSRQLVKGIATGEATGVFSGMVYVAPDAQHTDAAQQNRNLQLVDSARIYTRPQLEIYADDVKCGHGATIGRLDEEAIYYMRQRGVGESEARKMQMHGFAGDIINHCSSAPFREFMASEAQKLIDTF